MRSQHSPRPMSGRWGTHRPPPTDIGPAIVHWDGTSWKFVAPASTAGLGAGIAAVSANNIWAIIGFGAEQWNGTSWSQIANPSGVNQLNAVTALSDGTVVIVGMGTNNSAVILSNNPPSSASASAATPQRVASSSGSTDVPTSAVATVMTEGSQAMPTPLDTAVIDQFFAAAGKADRWLWLVYYGSRTRHTTAHAHWDAFSGGMRLMDQD